MLSSGVFNGETAAGPPRETLVNLGDALANEREA
jgi:hypothetical protein